MRFIVKYTKPGQIEGARLFDVQVEKGWNNDPQNREAVFAAARDTAGAGATIKEVAENDGTTALGESEIA